MLETGRALFAIILSVFAIIWQLTGLAILLVGVFYDYTWVTWTLSWFSPLMLVFLLGMGVPAALMELARKLAPRSLRAVLPR